jgi:hypothetical protein
MLIDIPVGFIGIIIFLFIFWKRLKEDYSSEIIFKTAFSALTGILIAELIAAKFYPPAFLWFEFLGGIGGLGAAVLSFRVRFYETFEAFIISVFPWLSFIFLKDSVVNSSLISFFAFLVVLTFIFIFYYLDVHYKGFTWYRSGRIGFAGFATILLIFVVRSTIALLGITVLSFLSGYEGMVSAIAALTSFALLFNLGRQKK